MAEERKIRCDCGNFFEEKKVLFDKFETEAMVCPKCNHINLTQQQAENYIKLKMLHDIIDAERRIIKVGNSMGITFPDKLHEFGARIGKKIKTEAIDSNSFKVIL